MPKWFDNAIFYEIYPSSFQDSNGDGYGDIQGIISRLDYIEEMGFNAIWLNPVFRSPFKDGGYDISDFFDVDPRFGTMHDLEELLTKVHKKGMHLILDLVAGHASEEHPLFLKSAEPTRNEYSDLFVWNDSPWDKPQGWWQFISGRYDRFGNYMVNFFSHQPAFNYGWKEIQYPSWQMHYKDPRCLVARNYLKSIIRFYLNKGFDGFRVDMADSLIKGDDDKSATIELWKEIREEIFDKEYPEAVLVSEWSDHEKSVRAGFHGDFYLDHFENGYNRLFRYIKNGVNLSFFAGHGNIASFLADYMPRYLACNNRNGHVCFISGNHDTFRLARKSNGYNERMLQLMYAFILTMPGVPFIYNGDEIGMEHMEDLPSKEGGYQRTGSRTPMQWDQGRNRGFSNVEDSAQLFLPVNDDPNQCVEKQKERKDSLLNVIKELTHLRLQLEDLRTRDFSVVFAEPFAYPFVYKRNNLVIAINPSNEERTIVGDYKNLTSVYQIGSCKQECHRLIIQPWSFAILKKEEEK